MFRLKRFGSKTSAGNHTLAAQHHAAWAGQGRRDRGRPPGFHARM